MPVGMKETRRPVSKYQHSEASYVHDKARRFSSNRMNTNEQTLRAPTEESKLNLHAPGQTSGGEYIMQSDLRHYRGQGQQEREMHRAQSSVDPRSTNHLTLVKVSKQREFAEIPMTAGKKNIRPTTGLSTGHHHHFIQSSGGNKSSAQTLLP